MVSLPIPYRGAGRSFGEIGWAGGDCGGLVEGLTRGRVGRGEAAHLDPDLWAGSVARPWGWRAAFGQVGGAQGHLAGRGVGVGDLFLFFGWFRRVEGMRYVRGAADMHALFGWLQVGEVMRVGREVAAARERWPWLAGHAHLEGEWGAENTVYVAAERLAIGGRDMGVAGGGVFGRFHAGLRLSGGATRSEWHLPGWMLPEEGPRLSHHGDPARWFRLPDGRCGVRTAPIGQEFVMECGDRVGAVAGWVEGLLGGG